MHKKQAKSNLLSQELNRWMDFNWLATLLEVQHQKQTFMQNCAPNSQEIANHRQNYSFDFVFFKAKRNFSIAKLRLFTFHKCIKTQEYFSFLFNVNSNAINMCFCSVHQVRYLTETIWNSYANVEIEERNHWISSIEIALNGMHFAVEWRQ